MWPPQSDVQYYGRGPVQLSWNYNYGRYSTVFTESTYNNKMHLLENPDDIVMDGYTAFGAAFWFWMTP